jgi:GT2 family glycosyltransferase
VENDLNVEKKKLQARNGSVASVTVTYNAARILSRQMDALLRQTRPLQEIIVVDNTSTDGTGAMLAERYPQVTVLRMPENLGVAGGWAAGLSYAALERGHGWVWTFDQDSVPEATTLESLFEGLQELEGREEKVGMVVPVAFYRETTAQYRAFLWRNGFVKPSAEQTREPIWFADMAIASGSLVPREVIQEVGVPRADFFMDISDFEYCLRIRSRGYKIAVISRAKMSHEIGNTRKINLPGYKRLWIKQPPFREYYISRNLAYLAWRLYPNLATKISIARYLARHLAGVLLFSSDGLACAIRMVQGFGDGLRGRLGIRMRPKAQDFRKPGAALTVAKKIEAGKG